MTLRIFTNIDAFGLQRNLDNNQATLARTLQRLSSGLRVNRAADDAAGLAVATRMESQIRGMTQAMRNTNDAISALQYADTQLGYLTERLQRARELGVQAANGSYSSSDRRAMNSELQQILSEFDRIARTTSFNGVKLLNGSLGAANFQIGASAEDRLHFDWNLDMRSSTQGAMEMLSSADLRTSNGGSGGGFEFAGTYTTQAIGNLNFSIPASALKVGAIDGIVPTLQSGEAASFKVDGITVNLGANYASLGELARAVQTQLSSARSGWYNVSTAGSSITITKTASAANATNAVNIEAISGSNAAAFAGGSPIAGAPAVTATFAGFSVDGRRVYIDADYSGNDGGLIADIQSQLDAYAGLAGVYQVSGSAAGISIARTGSLTPPSIGSFVGTGASTFAAAPLATMTLAAGDFQLQFGSKPAISITGSFTSPDALARAIMSKVSGIYASVDTTTGVLKLLSSQAFTVSGAQAEPGGSLGFSSTSSQVDGNLSQSNLLGESSSGEVVLRIDTALQSISQSRAKLGAFQSRLDSVISNLQHGNLNLTAARSRIMDADYAMELSVLVKSQLFQKSGIAMLVKSMQNRSLILALLR